MNQDSNNLLSQGITYVNKSFGLVLEWMENGDVLKYLRTTSVVSLRRKISILDDSAKGMEYLASHGIFHRDLAARNILLDMVLESFSLNIFSSKILLAKEFFPSEICFMVQNYYNF